MSTQSGLYQALLVGSFAALLSWLLVGTVRRYALRRALLDQPTARSSHRVPTPRGGGLGLVAAALIAMLAAVGGQLRAPLLIGLAGAVLITAVGWADDHRSLSVRVRLSTHCAAGLLLLPLALWPAPVPAWLPLLAGLWWVFWTVSAINVVNFMDGIDGLIGSQALIFGAHLAWRGASGGSAAVLGFAMAGAAAGFLLWNWPPAKIFLGDVGSGALGFLCVLGGVLLLREGRESLVAAYLPLYALFLDGTVTLVRRLLRGERVSEAHRSHLYQRLANGGWGHARVTMLYAGVALVALPIAALQSPARTPVTAGYFLLVLGLGVILDRRANSLPG